MGLYRNNNTRKKWKLIKYKEHEDGRYNVEDTDKFCVYASEHNIHIGVYNDI
jgi:GH35 family endo-1,4-beta-xylanase